MVSKSKTTFLVDFQQTEVDDLCGMKRWLSSHESGMGIQAKDSVLPGLLEQATHSDFQCINGLEDLSQPSIQAVIDDVLGELTDKDKQDQTKMELLYRRLGWIAAYALYIEPAIRMDYEVIPIDTEIVLDREPLWIITHPDRLLRHKVTKDVIYRELIQMPPGLTNQKWLHGWHFRMRMHAGMASAMEDRKLGIDYGQVMGMSEGYISILDGRLCHPYIWGYFNEKTSSWSNVYRNERDGYKLAPVWEFPGGIVAWVKKCGEGIANNQFPVSPPIMLNKSMLDNWVEQRLHREREIRTLADISVGNLHLRGIHFPRKTANCRPVTGEVCEFIGCCWNGKVAANPLKDNNFVSNRVMMMQDVTV